MFGMLDGIERDKIDPLPISRDQMAFSILYEAIAPQSLEAGLLLVFSQNC
jgi:hypothetical protein